MVLPNTLFIGPDKAGSTWLAEVLADHPAAFVPPAKDLYYFDRYYDRGPGWYESAFSGSEGALVRAEVCHDYLFSAEACARIESDLPDVRLLTTLRRPGERAFSSYLHMRKHAKAPMPFAEAIETIDELVDHGRYTTYLRPYVEAFGRDRIWVGVFDDLKADPAAFAASLYEWLGLPPHQPDPKILQPRLEAAGPRWAPIAKASKRAALATRDRGFASAVGRVKRSPAVQRVLYRPLGPDGRVGDAESLAHVDAVLEPEVTGLIDLIGLDLTERWYGRRSTTSVAEPDR